MSWQLLGLVSVLLFSISTIFQKIVLKDKEHNPIAFSILFQMSVGILIGIYGFINHAIVSPKFSLVFLNILLMIFLWVVNNIFYFKAMKNTDVSKISILFSTRVLFSIAALTIFLHQALALKHVIGTLLILLGVVVVSIKSKKFVFDKYDLYTLISAAGIGFAFANDKVLLTYFNSYTYAMLVFLVPGVSLWILYAKVTKEMKYYFYKKSILSFTLSILVYTISAIIFYTGLKLTPNASQYASINVSTVVVIVILSIIFLKERQNMWQTIIGALLSFVGLLLVTI